jgi:hypothetical protein
MVIQPLTFVALRVANKKGPDAKRRAASVGEPGKTFASFGLYASQQ